MCQLRCLPDPPVAEGCEDRPLPVQCLRPLHPHQRHQPAHDQDACPEACKLAPGWGKERGGDGGSWWGGSCAPQTSPPLPPASLSLIPDIPSQISSSHSPLRARRKPIVPSPPHYNLFIVKMEKSAKGFETAPQK